MWWASQGSEGGQEIWQPEGGWPKVAGSALLDLANVCEYFDSLLIWAQLFRLMALHKCLHKRLGCLLMQTFWNS